MAAIWNGGFWQNDSNLAQLQSMAEYLTLYSASIATAGLGAELLGFGSITESLATASQSWVAAAGTSLNQMARSAALASFRYLAPFIGFGTIGSYQGEEETPVAEALATEEEVIGAV